MSCVRAIEETPGDAARPAASGSVRHRASSGAGAASGRALGARGRHGHGLPCLVTAIIAQLEGRDRGHRLAAQGSRTGRGGLVRREERAQRQGRGRVGSLSPSEPRALPSVREFNHRPAHARPARPCFSQLLLTLPNVCCCWPCKKPGGDWRGKFPTTVIPSPDFVMDLLPGKAW